MSLEMAVGSEAREGERGNEGSILTESTVCASRNRAVTTSLRISSSSVSVACCRSDEGLPIISCAGDASAHERLTTTTPTSMRMKIRNLMEADGETTEETSILDNEQGLS